MLDVLSILGTRPEAIKMAPVISELGRFPDRIRSLVCVTGQHRHLVDQVLDLFGIRPDFDLDLMRPGQSLAQLTAALFQGLDGVVARGRPDWILAQGDTTTVMVAAFVAFYHRVRFGHVEAGLRTGDLNHPYPEEMNRRVADHVADLMFAPTERNRQTLLREGHPDPKILVTGNTVIDALLRVADLPYDWSTGPLSILPTGRRFVLVTAHRRENFGEPLRRICAAIRELAGRFRPEGVHFVVPVHPNPNVRRALYALLSGLPNLSLIEPLDYLASVHLIKRSVLILTDSGGIQEEAPTLGVPVLVLRTTTERPEGQATGLVRLVGTSQAGIVTEASRWLCEVTPPGISIPPTSLYGDGSAAARIVAALLKTGA
ncbi:MAG: non-hydrolyzing UDP-N-acetylglucosamine 2-epimerase [Planctomycetaceae bacterium]